MPGEVGSTLGVSAARTNASGRQIPKLTDEKTAPSEYALFDEVSAQDAHACPCEGARTRAHAFTDDHLRAQPYRATERSIPSRA